MWSLYGMGGTKACSNDPGHIYGKNIKKKSSSLEPKADDLETWYAASGTQVIPNLFK